MADVSISMSKLSKSMTMDLRLVVDRRCRVRMVLLIALLKLAKAVSPFGLKVSLEEREEVQ